MTYLIVQNGHIHDSCDNEDLAMYSCRELAEMTGKDAQIALVKATVSGDFGRFTEEQ